MTDWMNDYLEAALNAHQKRDDTWKWISDEAKIHPGITVRQYRVLPSYPWKGGET